MNLNSIIKSHLKLNLYFLIKLPMAFIAGLRVKDFNEKSSSISIPFKYTTKNPFRSIYFAAQSMAAELSTALLALNTIEKNGGNMAFLVVEMQAVFTKKAQSKVVFTCNDGELISNTVSESFIKNEARTFTATTIGFDNVGDQVAEFKFTWSVKPRNKN